MDDQFACAALFKGFLGTWPQLTDDMDGLSVLGEQARKWSTYVPIPPGEAGEYSRQMIRCFIQAAPRCTGLLEIA